MTEDEPRRYFFIHVMKTGGTSFVFQMLANFEPDEAYPSAIDRASPTDVTPYASIPKMLALSPERRARIRVYAGHLPYVASELLGSDASIPPCRTSRPCPGSGDVRLDEVLRHRELPILRADRTG